jgi:hypothetical protein
MSVPGIGSLTANAVVATIGNGAAFSKGRDFGAWLGLVPKQLSTGDRTILGGLSKRGKAPSPRQSRGSSSGGLSIHSGREPIRRCHEFRPDRIHNGFRKNAVDGSQRRRINAPTHRVTDGSQLVRSPRAP